MCFCLTAALYSGYPAPLAVRIGWTVNGKLLEGIGFPVQSVGLQLRILSQHLAQSAARREEVARTRQGKAPRLLDSTDNPSHFLESVCFLVEVLQGVKDQV